MVIGYTTGIFDLFHIGHLYLLRNAKSLCDRLIVGVTIDSLVSYKNREAVIPFEERIEIVRNIKCVDIAIPQRDIDKFAAWQRLHFDIMFVGDDWFRSESWDAFDSQFQKVGVKIIYLPYTKDTSSTLLREALMQLPHKKKDSPNDA